MNKVTSDGFTVIEVTIAVVVLSVGLLGLASTAAIVTRMIAQGQRYSEAQAHAMNRMEIIRSDPCPSAGSGSESKGDNNAYTVAWRITTMSVGNGVDVVVRVTSPTGTGTRTDEFSTSITCVS